MKDFGDKPPWASAQGYALSVSGIKERDDGSLGHRARSILSTVLRLHIQDTWTDLIFLNQHTISVAAATSYRVSQQPRVFLLQVICELKCSAALKHTP